MSVVLPSSPQESDREIPAVVPPQHAPSAPIGVPPAPGPLEDDLSLGACGVVLDPEQSAVIRGELSGFDDDSDLGESETGDGDEEVIGGDDDELDDFDEIDEDDFDDDFDDDFEEELEDEYEIEIEDEISAEFGLGPDREDGDEELDDLESLADDLDDLDDDLKD